jgi:hypothetical protein
VDQAYQDKLAGKISEEFWMRKSGEWQEEENQPTYGKPFDLIFKKVKTEEWCAQGDDFRTFLDAFVASSRENHSDLGSNAGFPSIGT